ncbi:hypothetical protein THICB1_100558 [Thiomonas arsenitoxydans]|uniref:Putative restriction endonuclease domain-containing protein n=1 Tax=Thiomonas arsenitoxydans (strain DSM 22701 / CIP 110005 / 3As) TaxID=426114 RepID=A0ABP1Z0Z5_THIA3|nr:hypothetical protein THICB1_100558 [Thiomonas arsenitoxydans]CQR29532.1 hypothetical protein ACO3_200041 [Thiomonas arsenitoxydans]CQR29551.1 hypothetical protein ACO7_180060 [Thiomonas arsenitoxydans]CQR32978.1 hypothetical protein THICB6_160356 [Thiomonas arsenitoxydans]
MTPQPAHQGGCTVEEYLALEETSIERHELIHGEIYAMARGTAAHASVCLNIASALKSHLRGTPCQSFMAEMRLNVQASEAYFYPDVFVTCGAEQRAAAGQNRCRPGGGSALALHSRLRSRRQIRTLPPASQPDGIPHHRPRNPHRRPLPQGRKQHLGTASLQRKRHRRTHQHRPQTAAGYGDF